MTLQQSKDAANLTPCATLRSLQDNSASWLQAAVRSSVGSGFAGECEWALQRWPRH